MAFESQITKRILDYLNKLPCCIAEKELGCSLTGVGRADINGCYKGRCIKIEVKSAEHKNKTSTAQDIYLEKWKQAGAMCIVAYSVDDVKKMIGAIDNE